MNGGTISGNTIGSNGGGVCIDGGIFTMNGGTISNNNGRGVYIRNTGTFTMSGGAISNNGGASSGMGVRIMDNSIFTMSGGTISNNTVTGTTADGGGVSITSNGTFTMSGGIISGNSARRGGGIANEGTFRIVNGIIYGSDAGALSNIDIGDFYVTNSAALFNDGKTAQRGTFSGTNAWTSNGSLSNTDDTIKVVNGELVP